jgi:hypothetical protein
VTIADVAVAVVVVVVVVQANGMVLLLLCWLNAAFAAVVGALRSDACRALAQRRRL